MRCSLFALFVAPLLAATSHAAIIGTDGFDYADGAIAEQSGGTGFAWNNEAQDQSNTPVSNWDNFWGATDVVSGQLQISDGGARREYGNDEATAALRGNGIVYYGVDYTATGDHDWAGMSAYDFGGERIFFGMPGDSGRVFGIDESGVGKTLSTIPVVNGQMYRLVAALDFDGDELRLWIDPDGADWDNGTGDNSADVTRDYGGTNWNTAVRLASGANGMTTWDNLIVATTLAEAVPEPSTILLSGIAVILGGLFVGRR